MKNVCKSASMIPNRSIYDVKKSAGDNLRTTEIKDFLDAIKLVKLNTLTTFN